MGVIINPGNEFFVALNKSSYVDKTGVIKLVNQSLETRNMLSCICLPSGFGKTAISKMLAAYYDRTCDSHKLFDDKIIAKSDDYREKMNHYNVLYVDMNYFSYPKAEHGWTPFSKLLRESLVNELLPGYSNKRLERFQSVEDNLERKLLDIVEDSGAKFVFIIDGWDFAARHPETDDGDWSDDINLMNTWFNSATFTSKAVAGVVMTGALPFRKDVVPLSRLEKKIFCSIPAFREYSLVQPGPFAEYFGFNEEDVRTLCGDSKVDDFKRMYGGYAVENVGTVFNPGSTLRAVEEGKLGSFWSGSYSSSRIVEGYVESDSFGFLEAVGKLLKGESVEIDASSLPSWYKGVPDQTEEKDVILTLMIYLGYLAYDSTTQTVKVPNEEVRQELMRIVDRVVHKSWNDPE